LQFQDDSITNDIDSENIGALRLFNIENFATRILNNQENDVEETVQYPHALRIASQWDSLEGDEKKVSWKFAAQCDN